MLIVTAGQWGRYTFGIRVAKADRDIYFSPSIRNIDLWLPGAKTPVNMNITDSFWEGCIEIRDMAIREFLVKNGYLEKVKLGYKTKWIEDKPPKFKLEKISKNEFRLK